jgi:hypothetical protein
VMLTMTAHLYSLYKPLYQISNKYLQNGYSVLYTAESLRDDRDKATEIGRY